MERFNLDTWLKDKSRKVIDDDGFPVEIIKWDANEKYPVVLLNHNGMAYNVSVDGMYDSDPNHGLFFVDEEEELTEFEKGLNYFLRDWIQRKDDYRTVEEATKESSKKLLDLARKELEKENSEFKPKFTYNEKDYSKLANKLIEFRNNTPLCSVSYRDGEGRKAILHYEKEIFDLVRNEIEKENPYNGKQKQDWSEEDEYLYNRCMSAIITRYNDGLFTTSECKQTKLWLKSLKDRVQPQPKQEWSEEDGSHINYITWLLEDKKKEYTDSGKKNIEKEIDWLKSLKPRWKPTEEQMQALFEAKLASINNREYFLGLLYEDLKKL